MEGLEGELRYAWRALDVLSQEYVKMWQRLEKMEGVRWPNDNQFIGNNKQEIEESWNWMDYAQRRTKISSKIQNAI